MLRLGLFHPNARSIHTMAPDVLAASSDPLSMDDHVLLAQTAEKIGLDYLFMADAWGPYGPQATAMGSGDPILLSPLLAATLIPVTSHIGLITTVHTSWFGPLPVARIGAAIDQLSCGRWGLNLVAGAGMAEELLEAQESLQAAPSGHDGRYERAAEFVAVLLQAWSGERIDFAGKHFRLQGDFVGPRTAQRPHPLLVSAGASDAGREFAGRHADYVFMPGRTPRDECRRRIADIRAIAAREGRGEDAVKLQMHASVLVRETAAEARAASEEVAAGVELTAVVEYLQTVRSNISTYDDIYSSLGTLEMRQIGSVAGARKIHGDPGAVADGLECLSRDFGCDGVALTFPWWTADEVQRFGDLVLPELKRRGLWGHPRDRGYGW